MALCAELPRVLELHQGRIRQPQPARPLGIVAVQTPEVPVRELRVLVFVFEFARNRAGLPIRAGVAIPTGQVLVVDLGRGLHDRGAVGDQRSRGIVARRLGLVLEAHAEEPADDYDREAESAPDRGLISRKPVLAWIVRRCTRTSIYLSLFQRVVALGNGMRDLLHGLVVIEPRLAAVRQGV